MAVQSMWFGPASLVRGRRALAATMVVAGALTASSLVVPASPADAAAEPTTFTIAQVPDTQQEVVTAGAPLLTSRYQWLADNKDALNLKYVAHSGDVVNWGVADPAQFTRADTATRILDAAGLSYGYAIGSNDSAAVTVGGGAAVGDVGANLRNTSAFNATFPTSRFKDVGGTFEPNKVDNMWQAFNAGGKSWLVLTMEMWPRQSAVDWAKKVVESHPDSNVIINTHVNIDTTGTRRTAGVYGNLNAQQVWDQLGSRYSNIKMILSSQYGPNGSYANTVTGVLGNKVLQVLTSYQSNDQNHVRLLKVDAAAGTVSSSVYVSKATTGAFQTGYVTDAYSNFSVAAMAWVGGATPEPEPEPEPSPTVFTLADVPDTQQEVTTAGAPLLVDRYQWLADSKDALNLKYLIQTGDLVNWGVADPAQFTHVDAATRILDDAGLPYTYSIGNHDGAAVAVGGSAAPGDVHANLRNTTKFNATFPVSRFKNVGGTFEPNKMDNMWQTFTAGGKDWLVLSMEIWPRQTVVNWAKQVVASHPNHNVIVSTHVNVNNTGERVTTGVYGDLNAQQVWDQLISQYPNIRMVLSGHYRPDDAGKGGHYADVVTGVNGNKVVQVMTGYHSNYQNHTRLLTIDTAKGTLSSKVVVHKSVNGYPSGTIADEHSDFQVSGMNWVGGGVTPPAATVPGAPTGVSAVPADGAATVSFAAPADGGSPIAGYTVTASPGGRTATGTASPVRVTGLNNGTAYTFTVKATNAVGTGAASAASAAVTPVAPPMPVTELLPDPGFESGLSGWKAFNIGTLTRVTSPVHSGRYALKVVSPSTSINLVGLTQNTVIENSVAGRTYTAQCWVRPSAPGLEVRMGMLEYTQNFGSNVKLGYTIVPSLPANEWTLVKFSGTATASGKRIIPQVYASFQTSRTGYHVYDDCSVF